LKCGFFNLTQKRAPDLTSADVYHDVRERVCLAEELGMTHAWFAEHHVTDYCLAPSPLSLIACLAGQTTRIKLAPGILVLRSLEKIGTHVIPLINKASGVGDS
jgi:alkanesulfonate monooxygenase SsuD/methylene tetrahydromethanopterin reductase-like flavin-dependent oxidoreductase (luciferase family)